MRLRLNYNGAAFPSRWRGRTASIYAGQFASDWTVLSTRDPRSRNNGPNRASTSGGSMSQTFGAWRATYTPGSWVVLAGPSSLVVMQPAAPRH